VVDLYQGVAEEKGVALQISDSPVVTVSGDVVRLRRALANLVDNAIKYTQEGGTVTVGASNEQDFALLVVEDSGMGISPDEHEKIWERLYRGDKSRSQRGLGLGLSFVKAIIEAHGGSVRVESEPGSGSRFMIRLPAVEVPR
jgi:signal transduction histidine kinase